MPELLNEETRLARKAHKCDYCGENIEKGEKYNVATLKYDGQLYKWKTHEKCHYIAQRLWRYFEPEEGLDEDGFKDGCANFCSNFVCVCCDKMVAETKECTDDHAYCLDKIYDLLKTHTLKRTDYWTKRWIVEAIKDSDNSPRLGGK